MFHCDVCGGTSAREDRVNEVLTIEGRHVLVEGIPASVCDRCGEVVFSREVTEKVRALLHGGGQPKARITLDVFALTG